MNSSQREVLSQILHDLDYPILAKHAIKSDEILCKSYVNLAHHRSTNRKRYDLIGILALYKLIPNERLQA